jgi:hypothetical protein
MSASIDMRYQPVPPLACAMGYWRQRSRTKSEPLRLFVFRQKGQRGTGRSFSIVAPALKLAS